MIKIENITIKDKSQVLFDRVSFDIQDDDFILLYGKSGSGKSLLSRCIAGIDIPDLQMSGNIIINDKIYQPRYLNDKNLRKQYIVGIILQNPSDLLNKNLTVFENIQQIALLVERKKRKYQFDSALKYFEFDKNFLKKYPYMLSEGEKQRVVFCMSMIRKPALIIADEITSAQDPQNAKRILDLLNKTNKENHIPTLVITHQKYILNDFKFRFLYLKDKNIIETESMIF